MPYYIGDVIKDYKRLVIRTPEEFQKTGIDARIKTTVEAIDPHKGMVHLLNGPSLPYDILVMATGADAVRLGIPGEDLEGVFTLRNLTDALKMKSYLNEKGCRKAIIIGAGYIGMEMCEALKNLGIEVKVLDILPRPVIRWDAEFAKLILEELSKNQVAFLAETKPLSIEKGNSSKLRLVTNEGVLDADMILIGVGTKRNTKLAESMGLKIGKSGAIQVDAFQRTSSENVYAVGDCCEVFHRVSRKWVYYPLGDIANKQGRIAGQNIGGLSSEFPGIVGAQSFKVFNLEVAATGLTEEEAERDGFQPASNMIWGLPVGRPMARGEKLGIKLIADKKTAKLLGAQTIGEKGAVQRINSLSLALWCGLNLDEISYVDLAYAPPFGGAWDAIHIAAQTLRAKI
ncbi:MAG: FAD-dependent oxidoreductase [Deltaproteobacteria bacterium]|nr:FAD-dependent oxidoreductase [Deltaproteobacteria bacterium]